jgi:8-oxo-dGTP pyrophosphatase MutT (NUDIX family)
VLADDDRVARIKQRLLAAPETASASALEPDWPPDVPFARPPVEAAVLIALVRRPMGLTVLYTERSSDLRSHSGQVAFPGGKIDPGDAGPAEAALREAHEEVALDPAEARILGFMQPYFTGSNYLITPVVALVDPSRPFIANPGEVSGVFEVPLGHLARRENFGTFRITRGGREHSTWQLDHDGHRIWGITANLTWRFRDLALNEEASW